MKSFLFALGLVLLLTSCAGSYYVTEQPAEPVYVRPVAPGAGFIWIDGEWGWSGGRYVYRNGYWAHARPGHSWHHGYWDRGPHGYRWHHGAWGR